MFNFRLLELVWVLAAASGLAIANLASESYGSLAFEEQHFQGAFGPSRGWPMKCLARATDEGAALADGSVIYGTVHRDVFSARSPFPHLGVSWMALTFNSLVGLIIVVGPIVIFRLARRRPAAAVDVPPSVR